MNEDWTLLISLPGLVVALIALYQRLMAHADLLCDLDPTLCCKWRKLWIWNLVTCVCEIILAMLSVFSAIVLIALDGNLVWTLLLFIALLIVTIVSTAFTIVKYVYLYRSVKLFRNLREAGAAV